MRSLKTFSFFLVIAAAIFMLNAKGSYAEPVVYDIDLAHSQVTFKVKHLGISNVRGSFDLFTGSYSFDEENPGNSTVETEIVAKSINTNNKKRDDHLRSDEFLDVEQFPNLTFKSKEIKGSGDDMQIVGDLTIHGVTKEVVLDTEFEGSVTDPWGNKRSAFSATTDINRKDFGMTWNKALEAGGFVVGDKVNITIEVQGIEKKEEG